MFQNKTNITYYIKLREILGNERRMFYEKRIVIINRPEL